MKNPKYFTTIVTFATGLVTLCTPEKIQDGQTTQQIDIRTANVSPAG